jgi:3-methyl-2-oxobutanoate hydroxymethyltransferase
MESRRHTVARMTGEPANVKVSLLALAAMKRSGEKIVVVTAYDAPSAALADAAGIDAILVGDSAAMAVLGHESTVHVTVDEMIVFTRAVSRGAARAFIIADMPFGSYQVSDEAALSDAIRFVKEGHADAIKVEGAKGTLSRVAALVDAGIPVVGHIGLTPQSSTMLGGYRSQGRTANEARTLVAEAVALQTAGCFAIVLEAMPAPVAARITETLQIPTIGIGSGAECDGQVLVWHDMLGLTPGHVPRFVKQYADLAAATRAALDAYAADVRAGRFPEARHTYSMDEHQLEQFAANGAVAAPGRRPPE